MINRTILTTIFMLVIYGLALFEGARALDYDYGKPKKYSVPLREVSIIVTPEGYYPKTLSVFQGERVRFFITSVTENKSCFILPKKELFMAAERGILSEGEAHFEKPGRYQFHCPTGKIKGHLTVLRKRETEEEKLKRSMASEKERKKIWVWYPKND